ncbi:hypothetical protein Hanom_Chr06g00542681 [Helianthus anomalus]
MSSVSTDTESVLIPKIPVTVPVYECKNGNEPVLETPKVGTKLVLKIFRFGKFGTGTQNICSSLTTGFTRTTSLPYNFFS